MRARQRKTEKKLFLRYRKEGHAGAREELIERFLPLARQLARRYSGSKEPMDDLFQVASLGLVKAVDNFDPDRGTAFSSYAVPTILGELKRHFRDRGWALHVPRELQERTLRVEATIGSLSKKLGRSPSASQVAEALGMTEEEVLEAMTAAQAAEATSLDVPRETLEGEGSTLGDLLGEIEPGYEVVEYGASAEDALARLSERDRVVLHLRFVEDLTQSQIGERVGISQMHVSRIIRRSLRRLREEVGEDED
jgi:RNA polymerase sigma-B factor